ncbi:MAG: penicillin-binding transpeptidase domain-containing protein [Myxococcota bacterium]|jgi:cell division protein FtsI (penicillin-binding protein 3)|nr:penicillin-binding transpeptidase domain-containing protein [Myxococcota bacterium]
MRSQALRSSVIRVRTLQILLVLGFLALAIRAGQLTVGETRGGAQGERQVQRQLELPGARGLILDRDHRELAISVEAPSIYVSPQNFVDSKATIAALARILERPESSLVERIGERKKFVYLARWVSPDQAEAIAKLDLPGVGIEKEPRRTYPAGPMAASLLGFVDIDGTGRRGVEQMMDSWLKGKSRRIDVKRDARGRVLANPSFDSREIAGGDIVLALDAALQAQAEAALAESMESSGARRGLVIVVEPSTGDILTLAEAPGFDPNAFRKLNYADTRSRAFTDAVEPGSTFKSFLVAAALDEGILDGDTIVDTGDGKLQLPGKIIEDKRKLGATDAAGVLRQSSNVGAALIAQELGSELYREALERFGFGTTTKSGFPSESAGLMRNWRKWQPIDQANIAFGQGVNVTAIQLVMAAAALANQGERMRPRIILARRAGLGNWESIAPMSAGRTVEPSTATDVLKMMESVVSATGTGRLAALAGVQVAGKTGTAQLLVDGAYSRRRHTAWFLGLAPAEKPKVAIVVALEEPGRMGGGTVAAPLFAKVATAQLAHYGILTEPEPIAAAPRPKQPMETVPVHLASPIPSETKRQIRSIAALDAASPARSVPVVARGPKPRAIPAQAELLRAEAQPDTGRAVLIPNFQGEGLAQALDLASEESLRLQYSGPAGGRIVSQNPPPGTIVAGKRRTVVVRFSALQGEG